MAKFRRLILMTNSKTLTTKEVARLCAVSDATVKRWAEAGVLRAERTNGGHRRFRVEEVARFQKESGFDANLHFGENCPVKTARRKSLRDDADSPTLFDSLIAGREQDTTDILINAYLDGKSLPGIFDGIISETMRRVGCAWYDGEISIAQEHLATRTLLSGIYKLRSLTEVPPAKGCLALICAVEADFHELPVNLAQLILENCGWDVLNYGANMPLYSFADQVLEHSPELICLSSTIVFDLERNARNFKEFLELTAPVGAPICIGGQAFKENRLRSRFPADIYAETFTDLAAAANKIADAGS